MPIVLLAVVVLCSRRVHSLSLSHWSSDVCSSGLVFGNEPTPEFAAEVAEECRALLDRLGDDELRRIAVWKLEGYTNREIARGLGKSLATVERKLDLIRRKLDQGTEGV